MNIKNYLLDYIRYKQLNWYGHMQRMDEKRLPRKNLRWCPPGRRRRRKGRHRNVPMQEFTTENRERGIGDFNWIDREGWRNKIYLL